MTITWHVDDFKVSSVDKDTVDAFIQWIKETYEDITNLNPPRGKIHDYLVMTLYYTTSGEVKIYMKEYIDKLIEEFTYMEELKRIKSVRLQR